MERGTKEPLFVLTLEEAKRKLLEPREPLNVIASCTLEQGVERWTEEGLDERAQAFESNVPEKLGLWVPASGAATRMFASVRSSEAIARLACSADLIHSPTHSVLQNHECYYNPDDYSQVVWSKVASCFTPVLRDPVSLLY